MIKQYFTDGLISLAILLSLLRTDLTRINDMINYPEVQDIILGQTAAYLPTSFHLTHNSINAINERKIIDFDTTSLNALYQHSNNYPVFNNGHSNDIEAFLVSAGIRTVTPQNNQYSQGTEASTAQVSAVNTNDTNSSESRNASSPTLPLESANSFPGNLGASSSDVENETTSDEDPGKAAETFNNPFPGCNLSKEDLELIEVLWRQDVDLGVSREVFDLALRKKLQKEQELEQCKINEKLRAQQLAQEKEDRERQEQASRWLRENFTQDGETGEWVRLQNASLGSYSSMPSSQDTNDEWTLEQALEYMEQDLLQQPSQPQISQTQLLQQHQPESSQLSSACGDNGMSDGFTQQNSLNETWQGLENYLQLSAPLNPVSASAPAPDGFNLTQNEENGGQAVTFDTFNMTQQAAYQPVQEIMNSNQSSVSFDNLAPPPPSEDLYSGQHEPNSSLYTEGQDQSQFLLRNATLAAPEMTQENLCMLDLPVSSTSSSSSLVNHSVTSSSGMSSNVTNSGATPDFSDTVLDWGLDDIGGFLSSLSDLEGQNQSLDLASEDLNLDGAIFMNVTNEPSNLQAALLENLDNLQSLSEDVKQNRGSSSNLGDSQLHASTSSSSLRGACGGSSSPEPSRRHGDEASAPAKLSRLSESSNDSGFQGFSNSSSPGSSPANSPASSPGASNMTASNHTGGHPRRPAPSLAPRPPPPTSVAHNHTYHTLPGHAPREVKKYMPREPSRKGPQSRDQKRASEMKIPFTVEQMINSPVEQFNEMISKAQLSESQLSLIRDIRRRGKNKVAAQNCRKRKVGVIVELADEKEDLEKLRERLLAERSEMQAEQRRQRDRFNSLYSQIFSSLRDAQGNPYDPEHFSLQHTSEGEVFLVPRGSSSTTGGATAAVRDLNITESTRSRRKRKQPDQ